MFTLKKKSKIESKIFIFYKDYYIISLYINEGKIQNIY